MIRTKRWVIILIILVIIAVTSVSCILILNSKSTEKKEIDNKEIIKEENQDKKIYLDINSKEVEELYKYIPDTGEDADFNKTAYQSKKVTIDDISLEYILYNAYLNRDETFNKEKIEEDNIFHSFIFEELELQKIAKKIYGKNITNKSFEFTTMGFTYIFEYKDGKYIGSIIGGSTKSNGRGIKDIKSVYIENDSLYIIDNYVYGAWIGGAGVNTDDSHYQIFLNSEQIELIEKMPQDMVEFEDLNNILDKYNNRYLHTFKRTEDGSYYWYSTEPLNENVETNTETKNEEKHNVIKEEATEKEKNGLVYSLYKYRDSEGNELYSIPYINIDSDDANKINKGIEEFYKDFLEEVVKEREEGFAPGLYEVSYNSYINDNILSLIITEYYDADWVDYKVYNLDINSGDIITNSDILKFKNITETKYLDRLIEVHKNKFIEMWGTKENWGGNSDDSYDLKEFYKSSLSSTISKENCSMETPMFLNENGKICVIARISSLAGADFYYHIINTNI